MATFCTMPRRAQRHDRSGARRGDVHDRGHGSAARAARYLGRTHARPTVRRPPSAAHIVPRVQRVSARRASRAVLIVLVLAGLWLMHGMAGTTDAGCHGAAMLIPRGMPHVAAAPALVPGAAAKGAVARAAASSIPAGLAEQMQHGELCVSGQPPTPGQDLLALLALLALALCGALE